MTDTYTVTIRRYQPTDPRLGRQIRHDSRSLAYRAPESDPATLTSVRHTSAIPVLDQGNLGSCTGNAATKCLSYPTFWPTAHGVLSASDANADETYAVGVYSDATKVDSYPGTWPPTDTGSDGLAVAKVLTTRGLISGYTHALSLNAVLTAVASQAVIVGTDFHNNMFDPASDGRLALGGGIAGGHEYVLDEIDVERQRVWMQNSWGTSWGINGRAYFTWTDFGKLLTAQGDCTVFTPATQPAPTPTPVPTPTDVDADLEVGLRRYRQHYTGPRYLTGPADAWLAGK